MNSAKQDAAIGERLKNLRVESGLTQADVVSKMKAAGVDHMNSSTLSRIEAGDRPVRLSEAVAFARLYGWTLDMLTAWRDDFEAIERARRELRATQKSVAELRDAVTVLEVAQQRLRGTLADLDRVDAPELKSDVDQLRNQITAALKIDSATEAAALVNLLREQAESQAGRHLGQSRDRGER